MRVGVRLALVGLAATVAATTTGAAFSSTSGGTPWPWPWSWDKITTFSYGTNTSCCGPGGNASCCSGVDSPAEIAWKLQYDLLIVDNDLAAPACHNAGGKINWTRCNDFRGARAADIKASAQWPSHCLRPCI